MSDVLNVSEMFGKNVFNDAVMRDRLPKSVYKKLKKTIEEGKELSMEVADGQLRGEPPTIPTGSSR